MDTFEKRRAARQAKIDAQMKAMENASSIADATYRNFMVGMNEAEAAGSSPSPSSSFRASATARRTSLDDASQSSLSEDESTSRGRQTNAMQMARNFLQDLQDEDDGLSYSSRDLGYADPELDCADASSISSLRDGLGSVRQGLGTVARGANQGLHSAREQGKPFLDRVGVSLQNAGRDVAERLSVHRNRHSRDSHNSGSSGTFRADNLHNLSAGLDNYRTPSFTDRTRGDRRASHLRDEDVDRSFLSRMGHRVEAVCFHRRCLVLMALATVVIAIGVAAIVTTSAFDGHLPHINFGAESEEELEAANQRYVKIRDRILFSEATEPEALESDMDSGEGRSPQSYALEWIARHDPMQIDPEDPYLLERYGLATFWFKLRTDGKGSPSDDSKWADEANWMSEKGFCSWKGVFCFPRDGSKKETQYDGNNVILELNLTRNELKVDELPRELYTTFQDVQVLDLSHNSLGGSLASEIGKLTSLEGLYIGNNSFQGQIPTELGQLSRLMNVYAHNNLLSGTIPHTIGSLLNLYALGLHGNALTGSIPSSIGLCTKLRNCYLDRNELSGTIVEEIYGLSSLADLRLRSNKLSGSISEKIGQLKRLEILYLDDNLLTSTSESNLYGWKHALCASKQHHVLTYFSPIFPNALPISSALSSVPREIGALGSRLEELHLQNNQLSGPLEVEISRLTRLKHLYLSNNKLAGTIPIEWSDLKDMNQLFLASNELTGTIPIHITGMEFLVALQLQSNKLEGTLPTELGELFRLEYLHLEENEFERQIPSELGQLVHLKKLTLQSNKLSGDVSGDVCNLVTRNNLAEFITDCAGESSAVQCICCSKCL